MTYQSAYPFYSMSCDLFIQSCTLRPMNDCAFIGHLVRSAKLVSRPWTAL